MVSVTTPMFFTRTGKHAENRALAFYCVDTTGAPGQYVLTKRSTRGPWKTLARGCLAEVNRVYEDHVKATIEVPKAVTPAGDEISQRIEAVTEQPSTEKSGDSSTRVLAPIVSSVWHRIKDCTPMSQEELSNYLWLCLERNRKSYRKRVVHTRLFDVLKQPIYITAHEVGDEEAMLENSHLVDTVAAVKHFEPDFTDGMMPGPIQWSYSTTDYVWDSTLPIAPISIRCYEHMVKDRKSRLSGGQDTIPDEELLNAIKYSIAGGKELADMDYSYALPVYSRKFDNVNMVLPLYVPSYSSKEPVAAILFTRSHLGYVPTTLISCRMAYLAVMAFRNPDNTWLKECKSV